MARGDEVFVRRPISLLRSHEWLALPPGARCLYDYLEGYMLEKRVDSIPKPPDYILASHAGLLKHPIGKYLEKLTQVTLEIKSARLKISCALLIISSDQVLHIPSMKAKYPKMFGVRDPNGDKTGTKRVYARYGSGYKNINTSKTSKNIREDKEKKKNILALEKFELFWKEYPSSPGKKYKAKARKKWQEKMNAGHSPEELILAARNFAIERIGQDDQFTMHPATFLGPNDPWQGHVEETRTNDGTFNPTNLKTAQTIREITNGDSRVCGDVRRVGSGDRTPTGQGND